VVDAGKPEYVQGDFLVRGLIGADPEQGAIAVGAPVAPGSVVRLHARDAASADADLRHALDLRRTALGRRGAGRGVDVHLQRAGARPLRCRRPRRGRGRGAARRHADRRFFAAGEIGPVGGEAFVHGFTATLAVFA
jgi:small ligand-binding sensory domain FIST